MVKNTVIYSYHGILLNNKQGSDFEICKSYVSPESQEHCDEWKTLGSKGNILYNLI